MKMLKKSVFLLLAAAAVASCSKSEIEGPATNYADGEIQAKSTVSGINVTRAAYEGDDLVTNNLTALVLASKSTAYGTNQVCNGTMNFNADTEVAYNKPVTSGDYKFPTGNTAYLTGFYPATGWTVATSGSGEATFTITGCEDVMVAPRQQITLAKVGIDNPALAFAHQLAWLKIFFTGDDKATTTITVKNITLTAVGGSPIKNKFSAKLATTQLFGFEADEVETLPCYIYGTDDAFADQTHALPSSAPENPDAYALVPPTVATSTAGTYEYSFRIDYVENAIDKNMLVNVDLKTAGTTAFAGDTKGKSFKITFNFIGDQIVAKATVTDWLESGDTTENI